MQRVLFIYNRHAGKNKTWASLSDIINAMTEQDCLVTTYPTQYRGGRRRGHRPLGGDFDRVVVAGETAPSAGRGRRRPPAPAPLLGYIPVGTTNDFAKNLNLPWTASPTWRSPPSPGCPAPMTWGGSTGSPFLYVAAFGAFTEIAYSTPQKNKKPSGLQRLCAGGGEEPLLHQTLPHQGGE